MQFIVKVKLKSGIEFAVGKHNNTFALCPIEDDGTVRGCFSWDTEFEARRWFKEFAEKNPVAEQLGEFYVQKMLTPEEKEAEDAAAKARH